MRGGPPPRGIARINTGADIKVVTTGFREGYLRKNGVPYSEQATITEYYARHGDLLTITMILTDPIYYEEPFIRNATFELDPQTRVLPEPCEPQVEIPRPPGEVPHYLPGENPYLREFAETFNLPLEAVRGGAATTYPEYGKKFQNAYNRALVAGYFQGRKLLEHKAQRAAFFEDLIGRMTVHPTVTYGEDQDSWSDRSWLDYYIDVAAVSRANPVDSLDWPDYVDEVARYQSAP